MKLSSLLSPLRLLLWSLSFHRLMIFTVNVNAMDPTPRQRKQNACERSCSLLQRDLAYAASLPHQRSREYEDDCMGASVGATEGLFRLVIAIPRFFSDLTLGAAASFTTPTFRRRYGFDQCFGRTCA
ncbi:unnamed protein product [Amoebophrya sp. A25]|nr:unnamed protein product [Amoebophrya sp. A25]|eukprot:GSA25T00002940001.1